MKRDRFGEEQIVVLNVGHLPVDDTYSTGAANRESLTPRCHQRLRVESGRVDFRGVSKVVQEHGFHFARELAIDDDRSDFEVQPKRAIVEVRGANGGHVIVDECDFLVHRIGSTR